VTRARSSSKPDLSFRRRRQDSVVKANGDPTVRAAIIQGAAVPRTSTPEEFDALIQSDSKIWGEIIRRLNIKLD